MELLTPGSGLLFQFTVLTSLFLFILSWTIILANNRLESAKKLAWLLGTLFLPLVGPILFFFSSINMSKKVSE
jgi:hypothetical protein